MYSIELRVAMEPDAGYVPEYAHEGDAGMDLRARGGYVIPVSGCAMVRTGVHVEIPEGFVGLVFPRSGLGSRGVTLRNAVGVIDSGYRGEVMAALWNTTGEVVTINKGDRVCQLVVVPYMPCDVRLADIGDLSETERGSDGHGSTGLS